MTVPLNGPQANELASGQRSISHLLDSRRGEGTAGGVGLDPIGYVAGEDWWEEV